MLETLLPVALLHWPFLAVAAVLWALGQLAKAVAPPAEASRLWQLYRQTMPQHPLLFGALLGACFPSLCPVGDARAVAALYCAASGVLSAYGHDLFRTWQKYRGSAS